MNRREFVKLTGSGMTAGALAEAIVSAQAAKTPAPAPAKGAPSSKVKFKVGTQQGDSHAILTAMRTATRLSPPITFRWSRWGG